MEITGKLLDKFPTQQVTDKFKKQEFVVEFAENPQYPELIKFELIQDKCGEIDQYDIGHTITVAFNLKGRKWDDPKGGTKYFNTLHAWRIKKVEETPQDADDLPF